MPPTSLFVQPTRCGLIRFYRRIYGIAPASLCERRGGFQLSLSANALAMYVMVSFSSWVCFGFCFSASRSRCLSWKGKRLRAMTHRMPTNTIAVTASIPRRMMDSHRLAFRALSLLIFWACSSSSCSFCRFRSFARSRLNSRAVSVVSSSASNMEAVRGLGVVPFSVVVAVGGHQLAE